MLNKNRIETVSDSQVAFDMAIVLRNELPVMPDSSESRNAVLFIGFVLAYLMVALGMNAVSAFAKMAVALNLAIINMCFCTSNIRYLSEIARRRRKKFSPSPCREISDFMF